jgi:hypothetical protein
MEFDEEIETLGKNLISRFQRSLGGTCLARVGDIHGTSYLSRNLGRALEDNRDSS